MLRGFCCRLQMLRRRRRISQRTLSELAGLSKNMVARYEKGEAEPSVRTLMVLADFFGVTADYLLGREKNL